MINYATIHELTICKVNFVPILDPWTPYTLSSPRQQCRDSQMSLYQVVGRVGVRIVLVSIAKVFPSLIDYYAATGPKYHLEAHRKKIKKAVKDPKTGKWGQVLVLEEFPAWHERRNKIFWRGSTTGGGNNPAGRQLNYQRHRFIRMTSDNSTNPRGIVLPAQNGTNDLAYVELPNQRVNEETMDAAFTSLDGCGHEKVCDAVREGGYRIADKVPLIDVTKYKMLIDIDGMLTDIRDIVGQANFLF